MVCRLCLDEKQMYLHLKQQEDVAKIVGKYFDLPLDIISHLICIECWNQVYDFHVFYLFVQERQKNFHLESQNLVYSSTSGDRDKDTNAEGNVLLVETEDATNTNAEKDVALLQTDNEDDDGVVFEVVDSDEEVELYTEVAEEYGALGEIDDETVSSSNINAEADDTFGDARDEDEASIDTPEDDTLGEIDDEIVSSSNINAEADDTFGDALDEDEASIDTLGGARDEDEASIDTLGDAGDESQVSSYAVGDGTSEETDIEDNSRVKDKDQNEAKMPLLDSTTAMPNSLEDTDDKTNDDLTDPLNIGSSELPTITKEYLCDKPVMPEPKNVKKNWKAFKTQQARIWNTRKKREEVNLRIASKVGDLQCDLCEEPLESFEKLTQHFKDTHNCKGYVRCCDKRYSKRQDYADHLELHVNPNFFQCKSCNKVLATRKSYIAHMRQLHPMPGSLKYQCLHCPMKYAERNRLTTHISRRHADGEYKCEECNKIYKTLERLKLHQTVIHKGATTIMCDICGRSFKTKSHYEKHRANVHPEVGTTVEISKVQQDVKQECPTCHKWFKNLTSLRSHMYTHHERKQTECICDVCGAVKSSKVLMYSHKHHHHVERRFKCSYCEKKFRSKLKLKEHEDTHTGIRSHKCELCNRAFTARTNLVTHKKTVHRDKYK